MPAVSRRRFDYSVPERWQQHLRVGSRVRVPFHGRRVGAWVVDVGVEPPPQVQVRDITGVSGLGPPPRILDLAAWGGWRWAIPVATLLRVASPDRNVWGLPRTPALRAIAGGTDVRAGLPALRREAPGEDLLPLVLGAVAASIGTVLVLVPSTGWAERLAGRLRRRGVDVASSWEEAAAGWPVVVGSRSAAWAPVPVLGAAVVLDAHDYHDRYDAADVVAERARRDGAPCVLVSPCPTAVQRFRFGTPSVPERSVERAGWPAVVIADRRGADPRTGLYSDELVSLARTVHDGCGRVLCVLNRTGRARLLACAACGSLARCAGCGRPVEAVGDGLLRCRRCGAERPEVCAQCGARRHKTLRYGVERVREELEALLGVSVAEVSGRPDSRSPGGPSSLADASVVVGTEAVLHRVRRADAVAFLDFDQHLFAPRFGAAEEAMSLIVRAGRIVGGRGQRAPLLPATAGAPGSQRTGAATSMPSAALAATRAGRQRGTVLVQTRMPDHDVLRAAVAGDPGLFTELALREELRLPPYSALATIRADSAPSLGDDVEMSPLGDGRWLARASDHRILCDALSVLHGGVSVDPLDV